MSLYYKSIIVLSEKTYCFFTLFISSRHYVSIQNVFYKENAELYDQRYSRTKVRDSVMRASLNLQFLITVLILFLLKSFVNVKIKDWLKLMSEQRKQYIIKFRYRFYRLIFARLHCVVVLTTQSDLMRQKDKITQSIVINANLLKNRLK